VQFQGGDHFGAMSFYYEDPALTVKIVMPQVGQELSGLFTIQVDEDAINIL
jgi:hypothetical protein